MLLRSIIFGVLLSMSTHAIAQTLPSTSPVYNAPYDTLVAMGNKALPGAKMMGSFAAANLPLMFFNRAIEVNKDRHEAFLGKATTYLEFDKMDEALEGFNACLEVSPDNHQCLYGIFRASFKGTRQYAFADVPKPMMTQVYNSAVAYLAVAPADLTKERANVKFFGYAFKLGLDNLEAFKKFAANNNDNPTEANALALEALIPEVKATGNNPVLANIYDVVIGYYFNKKDFAKVKSYGTDALATNETYPSTYYYLADVTYRQDKNLALAEKYCDAALKLMSDSRIYDLRKDMYYEEGRKAYGVKDYKSAAALFEKYVLLDPRNERAFAYLGFSYYSQKKYKEAVMPLQALKGVAVPMAQKLYYPNLAALIAFAQKPGATAPPIQTSLFEVEKQEELVQKGLDLADEKKYTEAIEAFNVPLAYFEKTNDPLQKSKVYGEIGVCYHQQKDYEKAKEFYKKSIDAGGYSANAYSNLGQIYNKTEKNPDEAEKIWLAGLELNPEAKNIKNRLAKFYGAKGDAAFQQKSYQAAIDMYLKSLNYNIAADIYVFLGYSYYGLKDNDKCREALENAKYVDPNVTKTYPEIDQVLARLE